MKHKQISIVGSGWLGTPLGEHLLSQGYNIHCSTTTKEKIPLLTNKGMKPFLFKLGDSTNKEVIQNFLKGSDIIVICFPPKRKITAIESVYPNQVQEIITATQSDQKVIFVSSTSVYQNNNDWVTENMEVTPEKPSGKAVLHAENIIRKSVKKSTTIRFAGLVGYDRLPGRFLANKTNLKNGKSPVNIIHRDDCIELISAIIEQDCWGEIINGCADEHPLREVFYTLAAEKIGLNPPSFDKQDLTPDFKKVSNEKSKSLLNFSYQHPDPLQLIK